MYVSPTGYDAVSSSLNNKNEKTEKNILNSSAAEKPIKTKTNTYCQKTAAGNAAAKFDTCAQQTPPQKVYPYIQDCRFADNNPTEFLNMYINSDVIENAVKINPNITKILASKGLRPVINMNNVTGKAQNHFITTYNAADKIAQINNLSDENTSALKQAALLHDIGKALIPAEILNKPGKLTPEEREIVDLHAELGYEILKTTQIDDKTAQIVRLHHYPISNLIKAENTEAQILSAADVYSALCEERSYKPKLPAEVVASIMKHDDKLNQQFVKDLFSFTPKRNALYYPCNEKIAV